MIAIIDYGAGNLNSVSKALEKIGTEAMVTSDPMDLYTATAMILPGVGSFGAAILKLKELGLDKAIKENVAKGKPLLGICLGMQLLFDRSFEDGNWEGLGLIDGEVIRFSDPRLKVPHMGWNQLILNRKDDIGLGIGQGEYAYFVHSYYALPKEDNDVIFYAEYGIYVPAVVRKGAVIGMQFHPEKSAETGIKLLENFVEIIKKMEMNL